MSPPTQIFELAYQTILEDLRHDALQLMFHAAPLCMWVKEWVDPVFLMVSGNELFFKVYDRTPLEWIGHEDKDVFPSGFATPWRESDLAALRADGPLHVSVLGMGLNGPRIERVYKWRIEKNRRIYVAGIAIPEA